MKYQLKNDWKCFDQLNKTKRVKTWGTFKHFFKFRTLVGIKQTTTNIEIPIRRILKQVLTNSSTTI